VRYALDVARSVFHLRHKRAHGQLARDFVSWLRVEFLGTAAETGVLAALVRAQTVEDLATDLGVTDASLLESLLRVGESVGELRRDRRGRWRLAGTRARAMVDPEVDGLAALPEEAVLYGTDVYRRLGGRLAGAPAGDYLAQHGELVARTSRVAEPVFGPLISDVVRTTRPRRVLDAGCGSGVNLRHVGVASPQVTGAGVDVDPEVVRLAGSNLATWGLAERFAARQADVCDLPPDLAGPWDLVLLFQNIYYFSPTERPGLLGALRALAPDGAVVVATAVAGTGDPAAAHLDVVLRSTVGNTPLPTVAEVRGDLTSAGFTSIDERRLVPFQPLRAFVAR
jgi:SAM-dependent methyltransferase